MARQSEMVGRVWRLVECGGWSSVEVGRVWRCQDGQCEQQASSRKNVRSFCE